MKLRKKYPLSWRVHASLLFFLWNEELRLNQFHGKIMTKNILMIFVNVSSKSGSLTWYFSQKITITKPQLNFWKATEWRLGWNRSKFHRLLKICLYFFVWLIDIGILKGNWKKFEKIEGFRPTRSDHRSFEAEKLTVIACILTNTNYSELHFIKLGWLR